MLKLRKKFGDVVTFWFGNKALVIVYDSGIARDIFKLNAFSGRPQTHFGE
jgi:hypothetical protein